jgi:hypothetical protein
LGFWRYLLLTNVNDFLSHSGREDLDWPSAHRDGRG